MDRDAGDGKKRIHDDATRWYERVLATHPEMAITLRDVPDAENGFLQWVNFIDRQFASGNTELGLPNDIQEMTKSEKNWNLQRFAEWLAQHKGLMDEIHNLGLLADQSMRGIDLSRFPVSSFKILNQASRLQLVAARLAAEQGDITLAIDNFRPCIGNSNHFSNLESPNLLHEVLATSNRITAMNYAMEHILNDQGLDRGYLGKWREMIHTVNNSPQNLASAIIGEWHSSCKVILMPLLFEEKPEFAPDYVAGVTDPDTLIESGLAFSKDTSSTKMWEPLHFQMTRFPRVADQSQLRSRS